MSGRSSKRARVDIYAAILEVIRRYPGGGRISKISYGVGVPIDRLSVMLDDLGKLGLVRRTITDEGETKFTTLVRGLEFLEVYWKMNAFLETFEEVQTRDLVAIVFTDIQGYTAQAQKNERVALQLLAEQEGIVRAILPRYRGREVKTVGDAFLIEFPSALEACRCAAEIQGTLRSRNTSSGKEFRIDLRVGIHIGDVERKGSDIVGDAVNIASRIQDAASGGETLISRQVFDQVWNKLDNHITVMGQLEAKNLQSPLDLFRIDLKEEPAK